MAFLTPGVLIIIMQQQKNHLPNISDFTCSDESFCLLFSDSVLPLLIHLPLLFQESAQERLLSVLLVTLVCMLMTRIDGDLILLSLHLHQPALDSGFQEERETLGLSLEWLRLLQSPELRLLAD